MGKICGCKKKKKKELLVESQWQPVNDADVARWCDRCVDVPLDDDMTAVMALNDDMSTDVALDACASI